MLVALVPISEQIVFRLSSSSRAGSGGRGPAAAEAAAVVVVLEKQVLPPLEVPGIE